MPLHIHGIGTAVPPNAISQERGRRGGRAIRVRLA